VYEHYAREAGVAARIINVGASSPSTASRAKAILRRIPAVMLQSVARRREFLTAHVPLSAELEYRLKVSHLRRSAAAEISKGQLHGAYVPQHRSGPIPGERLHSLGALERERGQAVAAVRAILQAKLPRPVR
jgi:hypothetical protein